ncbi:MAG: hypothetical protein WBN57_07050 [Gammaproteobacteria bacterium]
MKKLLTLVLAAMLVCSGCGDPQEGHVWKGQTDMIDKAGEAEKMLLETSRQQRLQIEEMSR